MVRRSSFLSVAAVVASALASVVALPAAAGAQTAQLSLSQSDAPDPVSPGGSIAYTLTVNNEGPDDAANVSLADPLPPEVTFVSLVAPPAWSCSTPAPGSTGMVSCSNPLFAPGSDLITLTVQVGAGVADGTLIANVATVTTTTADPQDEDNTDTAFTTVGAPSPQLSLSFADSPDPVVQGSDLTYTLTLTSTLTDAADGTLTVPLPAGTTFQSLTPAAGWSCSTPAVGGTGSVVCTDPAPPAPGNAVFTLVVRAVGPFSTGDEIEATASLVLTSDGREAVATDSETTTATGIPSLSATKTASGGFVPGAPVTFTLVLTNSGGGAQADNAGDELVDLLPPELLLTSATATSGTALANLGTNTVTWNGGIAAGGSVTVTINATIGANVAPGTEIVNQGTVAFDGDADGVNESAVLTDDPAQPGAADPTPVPFAVSVAEVPALGAGGLTLLALLLAGVALTALRARRSRPV